MNADKKIVMELQEIIDDISKDIKDLEEASK